ncbi:MAG: alanine dehydrogenase [Coriobacteriia bacterium]|nr:alanine dehydrogenase [Coriobacteriia bacterium]
MIVGAPREIKQNEYRVAVTPGGVREFVARGHRVLIEQGAGAGSSFPDGEYAGAGAEVVGSAEEVFERAQLVLKVKEPQPGEIAMLRPGQVVFAFLHLAPDRPQTEGLVASGAVCLAYETVELATGELPLLAPMSEVAGRMAAQVGAEHLQRPKGGRGVLMGGVPGVLPATVAVLGAGVVGANAAHVAMGMGAHVVVLDIDIDKLRRLDEMWGSRVRTLYSKRHTVEQAVLSADLVIGAVLVPGARAPTLVTRDMLPRMKPGAVVVDVAIDQGGCVETSRPTTHAEPTFLLEGIVHYAVSNMPGAMPNTSTLALTNATLRYALAIADKGWRRALAEDPALAKGANVLGGKVVSRPVAEAHGMGYVPLERALAEEAG